MAQAISKMETTQTAVEWLVKELELEGYPYIIKQAKAMEKEQIIDAHNAGKNILPPNESGEQYYNETYGGKNL